MTDTPALNILVAEDNEINQVVARRLLVKLGHNPELAENGLECLEKLRGGSFDLVFMDIQMPVMDGMDVARAIRDPDNPAYDPDIPIIALTAHAQAGDEERLMEAGMSGYLPKPLDLEQLVSMIGKYAKNG